MRRLLPHPVGGAGPNIDPDIGPDIDVHEAYAAPLGTRSSRPWIGLCMVSSIDGSTVVDGASRQLSSPTDSAVLLRLREIADVIVVGAGTVRAEGYGPPRKAGQRVGVVTDSGDVDFERDLFRSGAGFVITNERTAVPEGVDAVRSGADRLDLRGAVERLGTLVPCRFVQVEGGAGVNGSLFELDLVDEINLTTSPLTVGGDGPRLAARAADHAHRFEAVQVAIDEQSFVYTRWLRRRAG